MGIIQDTLSIKAAKDLEPIVQAEELTAEKVEEVLTELRKGIIKGPYADISRSTGVSEENIKEIHEEMNNALEQSNMTFENPGYPEL